MPGFGKSGICLMCPLRSIRPLRLILASRRDDRTRGGLRQALAAALLLLVLAFGPAQAFEPGSLTIETRDGQVHRFTIELAATPADRSQGLMFRESMAADHGMLFDFHAEAPVSMWMRNTVLP